MSRTSDTAPHSHLRRTGTAVAACLAVATVLAGCGGGDKVKPFQPTQVIAFGDENSAFDDSAAPGLVQFQGTKFNGARYTVNLVSPEVALCTQGGTVPANALACATLSLTPALASDATVAKVGSNPVYRAPVGQMVNLLEDVLVTEPSRSPTTRTVWRSTNFFYDCSPSRSAYAGNWAQTMAYALGSGLSLGGATQCPEDTGNGVSYAKWGAKVTDVAAQVAANRSQLRDGVLVSVMAGQNDIIAAYVAVKGPTPTMDQTAALLLMRQKGIELANVINDIVATGARVVYLTVPDLGQAPKPQADETSSPGSIAFATALTQAFNEGYNNYGGLVLSVISNGHKIVKVDGYSQIRALAPSYPHKAACDPARAKQPDGTAVSAGVSSAFDDLAAKTQLLTCTNLSLVQTNPGAASGSEQYASITSHLWADEWRLAPIGHASLGTLAANRVRDQL